MASSVSSLRQQFEQKQKDLVQGDDRVRAGLARTKSSKKQLNIAPLAAAGCNTSNNPMLKSLWDAVVDYNREWQHPDKMSMSQVAHSVAILDFIYQACATYMTDKAMKTVNSMGGPAKRKARYDAFTTLLQEVTEEIDLMGGKMLTGPLNFQENKRNYWLERLDSNHRAGYLISTKYNTWVQSGSTQTFWNWLQANGGIGLSASSRVAGYENPEGAQWNRNYYIENGLFYKSKNDRPLKTSSWSTEFSGSGWGVFVCSMPMMDPGANVGIFVFSYNHSAGWDHHSSFLGGAPVMAAGEWIVDNTGKVRVMTAKSGHYMPKWENLHRFVCRFPDIPGDAIIRPNMLDCIKDPDKMIKYYRISDFRARKLSATPLKRAVVMGAITSTGANSNITEHLPGGVTKTLSAMLPA
jgi:hypothetical protein